MIEKEQKSWAAREIHIVWTTIGMRDNKKQQTLFGVIE